ncbi:phosphoribosylamine--glycine ligase, chloroplastic-like [Rhodamnia argentea]|uniref:phosphoribosylamine--glycine ligase n=1 Tax=Rhodamnia argentea TaxID=178133 RepID=A0A8B8MY88_9MYRT|nr:phosphoribosylamine--glycine ligase, chloroplastic-like [Rhodamnia argentea]XP_048138347.1 phosphoribosylamine--glycine ligase, chloroplastic-like [Rhodamnia argentea]
MIQNMIKEGKIAPAKVSIKLLPKATQESRNDKFLLNEESRSAFEAVTKIETEFALFFACPVEEMERRFLSRSQGREDDNVEAIRKRFEAFLGSSLSVIEHCNSWGNVRKPSRLLGSLSTPLPSLAAVQSMSKSVPVPPPSSGDGGRVVALVIGAGGREHALCFALQRSPSCKAVFCAPGNAGISSSGNAVCLPGLDISDSSAVISVCRELGIDLVVVGPEAPLVSGIVDDLARAGILTFGPSSKAAALEGSKTFFKSICDKYNIPTAKYKTFTDPSEAKQYIKKEGAPIVVKTHGLAAGKGAIVVMMLEEAYDAVDSMLVKGAFGSGCGKLIVEEFLEGDEVSFYALVDGETAIPLASVQDHKRVGDGDTGLNTGGMGAYSPAPVLTPELQSFVMKSIILPTVKGMAAEGCKFVGVLGAGLIIEKKSGFAKLIEYDVRFGDPECQVFMLRLKSDLARVLLAACRGELSGVTLDWSPETAMVVVMASRGYPGNYQAGSVIQNLEAAEMVAPSVKIFHGGTAFDSDGNFIAASGRVLGVTAKGRNLEEARERAYNAVEAIDWRGGFYRHDIGWRALTKTEVEKEG